MRALTGGGMALKYASEVKDDNYCIVGFGGIGSAAALALKGMGKTRVDVIESSVEKRELANRLGFNHVYSTFTESPKNYSLVIEASGSVTAIEKGFKSLSRKGVLVFATHPEEGIKLCLDPYDLIQGKRIFGTWGGGVSPDDDANTIANLIVASEANLDLLLGKTFTIDEVNEGMAFLDTGKVVAQF
jgi:S-(hydroxymethyl)glutathione dehydrogenase / alcohol dehydrogenase